MAGNKTTGFEGIYEVDALIPGAISESRRVEEACGVVGFIALSSCSVEELNGHGKKAFAAALAIQGRGQKSAGASFVDNQGNFQLVADRGLVKEVFPQGEVIAPAYEMMSMHTLWSTDESPRASESTQPIISNSDDSLSTSFAVNGQILLPYHETGEHISDSHQLEADLVEAIKTRPQGQTHFDTIRDVIVNEGVRGSFSALFGIVEAEDQQLYAIRDPHGIRPLVYGYSKEGAVVASETAALRAFGAQQVGEIPPGYIYRFGKDGTTKRVRYAESEPGFCVFEKDYLLRPDYQVRPGVSVWDQRRRMGELLGEGFNEYQIRKIALDNRVQIVPMPDTAIPIAKGLSIALGVPDKYKPDVVRKVPDAVRSYISGDDDDAKKVLKTKFELKRDSNGEIIRDLEGKVIILCDDSVVRGNTGKKAVENLKSRGAAEVHLRVTLPTVEYDCNLGANIKRKELIAPGKTNEQIAREMGADSFATLSLDKLAEAIETPKEALCTGCLDQNYATNKPVAYFMGELIVEEVDSRREALVS